MVKQLSILESLFNFLGNQIEMYLQLAKPFFLFFFERFQEFDKKYPFTSQGIQLSFIYFFAVIDLIYSVLNNIFVLGYLPEFITPLFIIVTGILQSPLLKLLSSPEKVFFMSYLTLEFMVVRSTLNFSKFIKYNILLVFALLMLQGLAISFWDLLFHREITSVVANWTYDQGSLIGTNRKIGAVFFIVTFFLFIGIYIHFYRNALKGKIATLSGLHWVTDSVAFWLRIKTPTMKLGEDDEDIPDTSEDE